MEIRIQAIKFDIAEKLTAFINKKVARLERHNPEITAVDVNLKVVKPETANNKEALIKVTAPGTEEVVTKVADTFEEAVDNCLDALERQLQKKKERR